MKTAEEWAKQTGTCDNITITDTTGVSFLIKEIKQIQLDAMKEGMRRSAAEADKDTWEWVDFNCAKGIRDEIFTAAEQLTEKDL